MRQGFNLLEYGDSDMAIYPSREGKSVPQIGSHPVEQKIAQQITTEMKTTEMK
jgi:hypothetical protein